MNCSNLSQHRVNSRMARTPTRAGAPAKMPRNSFDYINGLAVTDTAAFDTSLQTLVEEAAKAFQPCAGVSKLTRRAANYADEQSDSEDEGELSFESTLSLNNYFDMLMDTSEVWAEDCTATKAEPAQVDERELELNPSSDLSAPEEVSARRGRRTGVDMGLSTGRIDPAELAATVAAAATTATTTRHRRSSSTSTSSDTSSRTRIFSRDASATMAENAKKAIAAVNTRFIRMDTSAGINETENDSRPRRRRSSSTTPGRARRNSSNAENISQLRLAKRTSKAALQPQKQHESVQEEKQARAPRKRALSVSNGIVLNHTMLVRA